VLVSCCGLCVWCRLRIDAIVRYILLPVVKGIVTFFQKTKNGPTAITWKITGLKEGAHGFHVHEKADFSNGCISAGPHYNPTGKTHGGPNDTERHVGDLGNIVANAEGISEGKVIDEYIQLHGDHSVIGRSIMVHADPDDLGKGGHELSKTTGNAGGRIACGEIRMDQ
jgi:superoxide dismutase, Cu-Zn family